MQRLTGCTSQITGITTITLTLSAPDLRSLKLNRNLGTSVANSFIVIETGNGIRASGIELRPILVSNARQANEYFIDTTRPRVIDNGFVAFDLDAGTFTIEFDEPVDASSIIVPGTLLFQHHADVSLAVDSYEVQSLSCVPPDCVDGERLTFTLPQAELNSLKLSPRVCTSAATCWLTIPSPGSFISDMAGNNVEDLANGLRDPRRYLGSFVDDFTGPILEGFTLNLTSREIDLTFDEPVSFESFNITGVRVQSSQGVSGTAMYYRLTEGTLISSSGNVVQVLLSDADINALQSRPDVATELSNTYITVDSTTVLDLSYQQNLVQAISNTNARIATLYVPDLAPPRIRAFDLNLDTNTISLTFSEPVLVSSVDLSRLLVSSSPDTSSVMHQLGGGVILPTLQDASAVVTFILTNDDMTFIEVSQDIATSSSDTYLSSLTGLADDTNGLTSVDLPVTQALQVSTFTEDTSAPLILGFTINMDLGEIVVVFDDVIIGTTFDVGAITLQSGIYRMPLEWHTLSSQSSTNSEEDGFMVMVLLGDEDLNRLKQIRNLTTSIDSSFLTATASIADDINGRDTIAVTDGKSLQATTFVADVTRPTLESWTLDLNVGQVILTFSETVDILTLQPGDIRIQTDVSTSDGYSLTGYGDLIPPNADYRFAIQLSEADANLIKANTGLGTSIDSSFVTITNNVILDMNSNRVRAIPNGQALQAEVFMADTASPILRDFSLDMDIGLLSLTFDETVAAAATFSVSALTLVNRGFRSQVVYTLVDSLATSVDSSTVDITLSQMDLNAIKAIDSLATSFSDAYISALPQTVEDVNGNLLNEVSTDSALQVSSYTPDETTPALISFALDLGNEQLILTFSETVRASSFDSTQVTVQSQVSDALLGTRTITLAGGVATSQQDPAILILQLEDQDADSLKSFSDIGTSVANTFLSLTSSTVQDSAGNPTVPFHPTNALQVDIFIPDTIPPQLISFALNLDQRTLSLTFDETVDSQTFSVTGVQLQDSSSVPIQTVQLGAFSTTQSANGPILVVDLSDNDFNAITATFPLATMDTNTFVTITGGTVQDTSGNSNEPILTTNALQITSHTADLTRPTLDSYSLDLDAGVISITFSESVNVTSFDTTQLTLQNAPSGSSSTRTLRGGVVSQRVSTTIDIDLLQNDLNMIKALPNLATLRSNTFLSATSGTVKDMNMNYVLPLPMDNALLVTTHIPDSSGPVIEGYDLDYNSGIFTLYYDETVDLSTSMPRALTFHNEADNTGNQYTLTSSAVLDTGLLTFNRIQLADGDLNELKRLRICAQDTSCFLSTTAALVRDTSSNPNIIIPNSQPISVGSYLSDVTNPRVSNYTEFNLNAGSFLLQFSETVDLSTLDFAHVSLDSAYANATYVFSFQDLSPSSGDSPSVTFQLSGGDLNRLKLNTNLCTHEGNCWIRFSSSFLADVSGNTIEPILTNFLDTFHQPHIFVPDTTPPNLLSYNVDLDAGEMTFTFNEVVREDTFTPMNLTFQDAESAAVGVSLRERGTLSRSSNGLEIDWVMTKPDLNLLKAYETIFSSQQTSFLIYDYLVEDVSGNGIAPRVDGIDALRVSNFIQDTTQPQLESFKSFNFDNWTLTLQFDEPINLTSVNLQEIAIARNSTFDLGVYDPIRINDWYSLYFENGSIYNLTHLFNPGEYILNCPFSLDPTLEPPTEDPITTTMADAPLGGGSGMFGNFSGSGTGSGDVFVDGSGIGSGTGDGNLTRMMEEFLESTQGDQYPILLRGCKIYRNLTVVEPFHFLTGGYLSHVDERKQQVQVEFNRYDLRILKLSFLYASDDTNTWIAFNDTALSDMALNKVVPTNLFNATKLVDGAFVDDVTPPALEFIELDMDSSILSLHFSDVMDVQSVEPLVIEISEYPGSNNSYLLQGPYPYPQPLSVDFRDNFTIALPLSFDDMNVLKNNLDLATSEANTYVQFASGIATDIYGRQPPGIPSTQVRTLTPDTTGSVLLGFDIDFNTGVLSLSFDEVVNPNTVSFGISIQNVRNGSSSEDSSNFVSHVFVERGDPVVIDTGVSVLELQLDLDLNALKITQDLAEDENNTFITLEVGTVLDMNNNENQPISSNNALQVMDYTRDTSLPSLRYFDLNLNDNFLILKFSEAVFPERFDVTGLTLLSSPFLTPEREVQFFDQNSRVIPREFNSLLFIEFTPTNEDEIKNPRRAIAKSINTTYLAIEPSVAADYYGFNVEQILETDALQVRLYFEDLTCTGLMAEFYINDTTMPILVSFFVNMNDGIVSLTFDETVDISTFAATELTLVDSSPAPVTSYTIRDPGLLLSEDDGTVVSFQLSTDDLNAIKFDQQLFVTSGTSYLTLTTNTIIDMSGNLAAFESAANATGPAVYVEDSLSPNLVSFELNLNVSTVSLTFDESVSSLDFNPSSITFLNARGSNYTRSYTLQGVRDSERLSNLGLTVTFELTIDDQWELKAYEDFATELNNTFLIVTDQLATDTSRLANRNSPIDVPNAIQADAVFPDQISPQFVQFLLFDLDEGTLELEFDEPINASSVQFDRITLLNSTGAFGQYSLVGDSLEYGNSPLRTSAILALSAEDIAILKLDNALATADTNTFVRLDSGSILDQGGNELQASSVLQTVRFVPDTTGPMALRFRLDMDEGIIVITFDDILQNEPRLGNTQPVDISGIALQRDRTGSFLDDREQLTSQPDLIDITNSSNGYEVLIFIPENDLNRLKANRDLATSLSNTFLTITAETIDDVYGNNVIPLVRQNALQASEFIADTTSPRLDAFDLSIDGNGLLTLYFSETVNQEFLDTSQITLVGTGGENFTIRSQDFVRVPPASTVAITLGVNDLNVIKSIPGLATRSSDTDIVITSSALNDTNGNQLREITSAERQPVSIYSPDITQPELTNFELDLNLGQLFLSFTETINGSSFDPTEITLQSAMSLPAIEYTLTGGNWKNEVYNNQLIVNLTISDLNEIKRLIGLADDTSNTYLSLTSQTIRDMNSNLVSNQIVEITFEALQTNNYTPDMTSPEIVNFSLNLTSETLELTFDETVNVSSLMIDLIVLQEGLLEMEMAMSGFGSGLEIITTPDTPSLSGSGSGSGLSMIKSTEDRFSFRLLTVGAENSSFTVSADSTVIVINLGPDDLNSLKLQTDLATDINNTFISFPNTTVSDMNGNLVSPVSEFEAVPGQSFFPDLLRPELIRFDLNLTSETLTLTFSEVVNASSIDISQLTLQSQLDGSLLTAQTRTLTFGGDNGTTSSLQNGLEVVLFLGPDDLNEIKRLTSLATSELDTFLVITSNAIRDMNDNLVTPKEDGVSALQVTLYTEDRIPPHLGAFNLDVNSGIITLEFSETVNSATLNVTYITILSDVSSPNQTFTLTSVSGTSSVDNTTVVIDIGRGDLNAIKFLTQLAQDLGSTFISVTNQVISDMNLNAVVPISVPLSVSTYLPDVTGPIFEAFDINLDTEILSLYFDETVNVSSMQFMLLTVQDSLVPTAHYNLSGGVILGENTPDVQVVIDFHDLNQLKLDTDLATNINNTYLQMEMGAVADLSLSRNQAFFSELRANNFFPDLTRPQLTQFSVNLNLETLTLNFDEPVNASSLDPTGITLTNGPSGDTMYTLTGGNTTSVNGLQLVVYVSVHDLNEIKRQESLFVDTESSFIAISQTVVSDMSGNPVVEITVSNALNTSAIVNDTTRPQLRAFDLDFNIGVLTLEFVETVNTSSIDFSGIILQQSSNTSNQYTLTGGDLLSMEDSTVVRFSLLLEDLNAIKALEIALFDTTTWLSIQNFTILDQNQQPNVPLINGINAQNVRNYTSDQTPPTLEGFVLDLNSDTLTLMFSETVNVISTLNVGSLTLLSEPDANLISDPRTHAFGLDVNNTLSEDIYVPTVTIRLGRLDLNVIKRITQLATNENNTFMAIMSTAISDMNFNPVVPISFFNPLGVTEFVQDDTPPVLETFDLDMNQGTLMLYFSETIDPTTLDIIQVALQYAQDSTDSVYSHVLSGGFTTGEPAPTILVELNIPDLNEIKRISQLAVSADTTYIRITRGAVRDMNDNSVATIFEDDGLQVSQYMPDMTSPDLVRFDLDLSRERLILTFSETVNASSVDTSGIVLQSAMFSDPPSLRQLVGGTTLTLDDTVVVVQLDAADLNYIKSIANLCTANFNTYIRIESFVVVDMFDNAVVELPNGRAIQVTNFTADEVDPIFVGFDLDLNTGMIYFTFNETVNTSTLVVDEITLQSDPVVGMGTTQFTFHADSGSGSNSPDWPMIIVDIGAEDLNEIKRLTELATSSNDTFLSLSEFAIQDANMNQVVPDTLQVTVYTEDTTPPEVSSFVLDLNTGQLHLTFSETINISSLDPTQLTLQSMQIALPTTDSLTLAGGVILTPYHNTTATIELLKEDLDTIKGILPLAMNGFSTFLSVTGDTVSDMSGNRLVSIIASGAMGVSEFIPDTTSPVLEGFSLDMNSGLLTFTFSETIDYRSINFQEFYLQDDTLANSTFQFATSAMSTGFQPVLFVYISKSDLDLLKENRQVGTSMNDTYIALSNFTIHDTSSNPVVAIVDGTAHQVDNYTRDSTPPVLQSFNLDVNVGVLTLFYSETIDIFSLDPTKITLQNGGSVSSSQYTLTGGFVTPVDSTVGFVDITIDDLNEIKRLVDLATCTVDNTYISLVSIETPVSSGDVMNFSMDTTMAGTGNESTLNDSMSSSSGSGSGSGLSTLTLEVEFSRHVSDMAGNLVISVPEEVGLQVSDCIPDATRPQLVNFTLNMHNSTLTLTFDETVNVSSLDIVEIIFYNDRENSTESYQLTAAYATNEELTGQLVVELIISNTDLNELKRREDLSTASTDSQILISEFLVLDMNGNRNMEIPITRAIEASVFIPDLRAPVLLSFELDMTLETLTLSFSETINASSLMIQSITIQNENFTSFLNLTSGYFLTPGNQGPPNGPNDPVLVVQLTDTDLNYIKSVTDLATSLNDTFISIESSVIADMNGNLVEETLYSVPLQANRYTQDNLSPFLVSFTIDINSGELFLTFDETVNVSTLSVEEITLQSAPWSDQFDQLRFSPGNTSFDTFSTSLNRHEIIIDIGINDLNEIKRLTQIASSINDTYLLLTESAIEDMNGNRVTSVANGNASQATLFRPDVTEPMLISFILDLDLGVLHLTFDETVNYISLNLTSLGIQNEAITNDISVQLAGGDVTNSYDGTVVNVTLVIDDLNEIKAMRPLATSVNNTYLRIFAGGILDMNNNPVVVINFTDALPADGFVQDQTDPMLVSFNINLDSGMLELTFDETVEADSLDVMQITLQDATMATSVNNTYTLTGGLTSVDDSTTLVVNFTFLDLNEIKKIRELASNLDGSNTFVSITNKTVVDMNENPVVSLPDGMALRVTNFTEDTTRPQLISFDLDMNLGYLVFNFSETVDTLTFNVTEFKLQNTQNASMTALVEAYSLTEINLLTGDDVEIVQGLLYIDLNAIKSLGNLASSTGDTYLSLTSFAISDMNGNPVVPIQETDALQVTAYTPDRNRPLLVGFDLDMNLGMITITFSETVNVSTLDVTEISILADEIASSQMFQLTESTYSVSDNQPIFVVQIGEMDLNVIKRLLTLAISTNTTYLMISEFTLRDAAGNMNLPVNATQVSMFTPDTTAPVLVSYDLDLSIDTLTLRFSETVSGPSLNINQLTFISGSPFIFSGSGLGGGLASGSGLGQIDGDNTFSNYSLTGGENLPLTYDSTEFQIKLTFADRNELKRLTDLATSQEDTFVGITSGFIEDTNGNIVIPINTTNPLQVTNYTADSTRPELVSFNLDMDSLILTLEFSETMNVTTLNVSEITIQSTQDLVGVVSQYHTLTGNEDPFGSSSLSQNGPTVILQIGETDANIIKFLTELAQSFNSTFISLTQFVIEDMNANRLVPVMDSNATQVSFYVPDMTGPTLRNFSLNLTSERLFLTFDETVNFESIQPSLITIQNAPSGASSSYTLTSAVPIGINSQVLVLNLTATQQDLNEIKLRTSLATELGNTIIQLSTGALADLALNANPVLTVVQEADTFFPDSTPPTVVSFSVNVNSSLLTIVFDEVVNVSSLDPTAVRLQNSSSSPSSYLDLTGECILMCMYALCMYESLS